MAWDSRSTLVALNALTPALFLPAWPVAAAAGLTRRWGLAAGALLVVVGHICFLAPELAAREPVTALPEEALRFRLFSANVQASNDQPSGIAQEIRDARPDVVFLQEAVPDYIDALDRAGALRDLPYRVTVARTDPFAGLVASRWPLTEDDILAVAGRPVVIRATVVTERGPVRLYSVHVVAPVAGDREAWDTELGQVLAAVRSERGPVVVAGDFNATWGNRPFRRLTDAGLTDAAAARGQAFQMTWPNDRRFLPPLARIDHVLTTDGLAVTALRAGAGQGSDHRPLVADIAATAP